MRQRSPPRKESARAGLYFLPHDAKHRNDERGGICGEIARGIPRMSARRHSGLNARTPVANKALWPNFRSASVDRIWLGLASRKSGHYKNNCTPRAAGSPNAAMPARRHF